MGLAKPTIMTAVPRFYQNLFTKININFEKQTGIKKKLINKTLKLGKKILRKEELSLSEKIINFICNILVRKKNPKSIWWKSSSICFRRWGVRSKYWRVFKRYRTSNITRLWTY